MGFVQSQSSQDCGSSFELPLLLKGSSKEGPHHVYSLIFNDLKPYKYFYVTA